MLMLAKRLLCVYEVAAVAETPPEPMELVVLARFAVAVGVGVGVDVDVDEAPNKYYRLWNSPSLQLELHSTLSLMAISLARQTTLKLPMDGFHRITLLRAPCRLFLYLGQIPFLTQCLTMF